MEIRPLRETDDRLNISRIYEREASPGGPVLPPYRVIQKGPGKQAVPGPFRILKRWRSFSRSPAAAAAGGAVPAAKSHPGTVPGLRPVTLAD